MTTSYLTSIFRKRIHIFIKSHIWQNDRTTFCPDTLKLTYSTVNAFDTTSSLFKYRKTYELEKREGGKENCYLWRQNEEVCQKFPLNTHTTPSRLILSYPSIRKKRRNRFCRLAARWLNNMLQNWDRERKRRESSLINHWQTHKLNNMSGNYYKSFKFTVTALNRYVGHTEQDAERNVWGRHEPKTLNAREVLNLVLDMLSQWI